MNLVARSYPAADFYRYFALRSTEKTGVVGMKLLKLEILGPLVFAFLLLVISSAIKGIAFDSSTIWFEIAPELSLWAVGILFSLAVSERTLFRGKLTHKISPISENEIKVKYSVTLPDTLEFSPKYLYLFVFEMMIWILIILITGETVQIYSLAGQWSLNIYFFTALGHILSGIAVGIAIYSLFEVAS